ncbi:MAG: M60 family metallopeptidase [Roseburia sp.]|nr:M60 family metallopeptidase [Roseburia sp.]
MAEKDSKPKTTAKPTATVKPATAAKPAAKPAASVKPATAAKPAATVKPAAATKPAAKPAASVKPTAAAKPTATVKPAAKVIEATPKDKAAPATKPAAKTTPAPAKPAAKAAEVKPVAATKPAATAKTAEVKPAAKTTPAPAPAAKPAAKAEPKKAEVAAMTAEKPEKAKKQPAEKKAKPAKSGKGGKTSAVASIANNKIKFIIMAAVAFVLIAALIIGIVVGTKSCKKGSGIPPLSDGPTTILPPVEGGDINDDPADDDPNGSTVAAKPILSDKPAAKETALLSHISADDAALLNAFQPEYTNTSVVGFIGEIKNDDYPRNNHASGATENIVPAVSDERDAYPLPDSIDYGTQRYPTYGSTMRSVIGGDDKKTARQALINESSYLTATGTANAGGGGYTWMDKDGYLYSGTTAAPVPTIGKDGTTQRKLYKHTAATNLYLGNVSDDERAVVKEVTMRPRGYNGYGVTGIYAPAGEVIKIEISEADMEKTGGITIHIGQALYNGQANNIWADKGQMQRIPHLLNTMNVNKNTSTLENGVYTAYVGSFIGGPLYIRNTSVKFTATISGGVEYPHFILGYTTPEDLERTRKSSAPYFDLEVWNYGVLHSGPRTYANAFSYDDLYKAAVLWEKVASVTTSVSNQGIVFLYDPFVAAGAAVAFPGRRSVNCPLSWMAQSLNYNSIVTSGSWGNFHEYHHNFQGFGVGNGGEVTNNSLTLVSYALFTKISSNRGIGSFGAQGLGGWNNYTSATWALEETLKIKRADETPGNGNQGLALYATLLHNFGADAFTNTRKGGQSYAGYMGAWQDYTHNNMYYYFNDILGGTGISNNAPEDYPMFVPVSSVYQTGRSFMYDGEKKYFKTMQPYVIPAEKPFTIDLSKYTTEGGQYRSGSIVIPDGFTYRVKSITAPINGKIAAVEGDNFKFTYTPDGAKKSGEIIATLEIVKNDGSFKVDDVDLIIEFEPSRETTKLTLERTTYSYTADKMYTDAVEAYNANFAGYDTVEEKADHSNPTQNANTDIWYWPNDEANHTAHPNAPDNYFFHDNRIEVIDGKLFFEETGKYRVYLRGRTNAALYFSLDGLDYKLGGRITASTPVDQGATYLFRSDPSTYFDIEFTQVAGETGVRYVVTQTQNNGLVELARGTLSPKTGEKEVVKWLYIKEVLIVQPINNRSYIGVGMKQWTEPQFTQNVEYYREKTGTEENPVYSDRVTDAQYNEMTDEEKEALYQKIIYLNNAGQQVSEATVLAAEMTPPVIFGANANASNKMQPYVNAYRASYEFPDNKSWESDYFYTRSYNYNYAGEPVDVTKGKTITPIADCNYIPWTAGTHDIGHLFDDDLNSIIFFSNKWGVSANKPAILAFDMGEVITANSMALYVDNVTGGNGIKGFPGRLTLQGSLDGTDWFDMGTWSTPSQPEVSHEYFFNDNKSFDFRYFKLTITGTCSAKDTAGHVHSGNNRIALSEMKFFHTLRINGNGANHVSPDNQSIIFTGSSANSKGSWKSELAVSSFGRVYVGQSGDKVKFSFTGTRLAILTPVHYDDNFEVYIDGNKVTSIKVAAFTEVFGITYLSEKLTSEKHTVEIRCTGETAFDSFAFYNETD